MENKKVNKYMVFGLLIISIKYLVDLPYSLACFSTGLGIALLLLGLYAINNDMGKLKKWKRNLFKSIRN